MSKIFKIASLALVGMLSLPLFANPCDGYLGGSKYPNQVEYFGQFGQIFAYDKKDERFFGATFNNGSSDPLVETVSLDGKLIESQYMSFQGMLELEKPLQKSNSFATLQSVPIDILEYFKSQPLSTPSPKDRLIGFFEARREFYKPILARMNPNFDRLQRAPNGYLIEDILQVDANSTEVYFRYHQPGAGVVIQKYDFAKNEFIGERLALGLGFRPLYFTDVFVSEDLIAVGYGGIGESTSFFDAKTGEQVKKSFFPFLNSKFSPENFVKAETLSMKSDWIELANGDLLAPDGMEPRFQVLSTPDLSVSATIKIAKESEEWLINSYGGISLIKLSSFQINEREVWVFLRGQAHQVGVLKILIR